MNIVFKEIKELVRVLHNNREEMLKNVKQLREEGWSDNIRGSIREEVREDTVEDLKERYPDVEIQYPQKGGFYGGLPYVYVTQHEREIKGE
jgi:hypothetical protein